MDDDIENLVNDLLDKVRRILPVHDQFIADAEARNAAPKGWIAHAREDLDAVRKAVQDFEEYDEC